jgi:hypothetical protein
LSRGRSSRGAGRRGGAAAHARADGDNGLFHGRGRIELRRAAGRDVRRHTPLSALGRSTLAPGDPGPIAGCVGEADAFDRAMESFAFGYADQNERDHAAFAAAVKAGRLAAVKGA